MRLKLVAATVGLGALCLLALALTPPKSRTTSTDPAGGSGSVSPPSLPTPQAIAVASHEEPVGDQAERSTGSSQKQEEGASAEERHEAYVETRTAELRNLSGKTDPAALEVLLSEVKNPEPEIRQAALDALIQSGQRSAIPRLEQAAALEEDVAAKRAIVETIEFLKLPTLTETLRRFGEERGR